MVKYKINLKFKEEGKSLNEIITNALKIEIEKRTNMIYNNPKMEVPCNNTHYSNCERNMN